MHKAAHPPFKFLPEGYENIETLPQIKHMRLQQMVAQTKKKILKETSDKMQIGRPTAETFFGRNPKKEFENEKEELLESYANPKIVKERYRPQNIYAKKQNDIKIGLWRRKLR